MFQTVCLGYYFYCAFGPTLAAMWLVCNWPWTVNPCRQAHSLFFLKMGNLRWYSSPQPRFQAVGLAEPRCETNVYLNLYNLKKKFNEEIELEDLKDTCPWTLVHWHTCVIKGGRRERARVGGKRKTRPPKRRKQVTTSEGWKLTWALFKDNACHWCSFVTWQAGARKGTWQTFTQHGSCFCKHKNSLRP